MENEREYLTIGALLHDIGKLVRRAGLVERYEPHTLAGHVFIKDVESNGEKILAPFQKFMFKHHERDLDESDPLTWYVCLADNLASSERQTSEEEGFDELRTLENVLARIERDEEDTQVNYFKPGIVPEVSLPDGERSASVGDFRKIYDGLVRELSKVPLTVENVRFLLYKYLSFIPQSTQKSGIMDISLYDHLKITAMVALCMYDYVKAKGLKIEKYHDLKRLEAEPILLLVQGDVSGIQKFIKSVSSKGALRSFRGRSIFIDLLQEIVVEKILEETGFFRTNVHFIGGGHFYLVLSNTEENVQKLEKIKKFVNQWLLEKTRDLRLVIGYEPMKPVELKDPSNVFERLSEKIRTMKLRMYSPEELRDIFDVPKASAESRVTCKVCGRRVEELYPLREDLEPIACSFCRQMYELGKMSMRSKYFAKDPYGEFEILYENYSFGDRPLPGKNYALGVSSVPIADSSEFVFVDIVSYAKHEEFEEIAEESAGGKLACLQADLDRLGSIFRHGLKVRTLSRMSTMSRLLTYFFKYRVRQMVEGKNIVLVYSGGDDLFIVGGWEDVWDFAQELHQQFVKFTGNPNVTFTAAFVLFDEKETISRVKEKAEEMEKMGKRHRNCIVLAHGVQRTTLEGSRKIEEGQVVAWNDFSQKTYPVYRQLADLVKSVDRSVIRKALNLSLEDSPMNRAFLAYIEAREHQQDKAFVRLIRTSEVPALNAVLQLIDLKARRGEE